MKRMNGKVKEQTGINYKKMSHDNIILYNEYEGQVRDTQSWSINSKPPLFLT